MGCRMMQVIECTELRHGSGKDMTSPVRIVTQYWSTEGVLLAEIDPCSVVVRIEDDPMQQAMSQPCMGVVRRSDPSGSATGGDR